MTDSTSSTSGDPRLRFDRVTAQTALGVATRASSIHNTQPWRWRLGDGVLALLADRSRQLAVADPDGHSLLVSCGAALYLTEIALHSAGWQLETTVLPDPAQPDVLAWFAPRGRTAPDGQIAAEVAAALRRRCDRRPFAPRQLTEATIEALRSSGNSHARVDFPDQPDNHVDLAAAVSWADRVERQDEAYLAEMSRWLRDPEVHAMVDGVPVDVIPHVAADSPRHTDVPLRDFEVGVTGRQMIERDVDEHPVIAVIFSDRDSPSDHLQAGVAMMRLMLQAELLGLASCPLSQAVDFAAFRTRLQARMGWIGYPQMMLRIGYPSSPTTDLPRTPRRSPSAVLDALTTS